MIVTVILYIHNLFSVHSIPYPLIHEQEAWGQRIKDGVGDIHRSASCYKGDYCTLFYSQHGKGIINQHVSSDPKDYFFY